MRISFISEFFLIFAPCLLQPKKPKPRPPSSGRPGSRSRRFHHYSYPSGKTTNRISLSSKNILPPVGQVLPGIEGPSSQLDMKPARGSTLGHLLNKDHGMPPGVVQLSKVSGSYQTKDQNSSSSYRPLAGTSVAKGLTGSSDITPLPSAGAPTLSSSIPSSNFEVPSNLPNSSTSVPGLTRLLSRDNAQNSSKDFPLELMPRPPSSAKPPGTMDRQKGIILESLSQQEARGLLRQASIERLGSSNLISNFVPSASKPQVSSLALKDQGQVPSPEGRLLVSTVVISCC